jgi:hypothetical protein
VAKVSHIFLLDNIYRENKVSAFIYTILEMLKTKGTENSTQSWRNKYNSQPKQI